MEKQRYYETVVKKEPQSQYGLRYHYVYIIYEKQRGDVTMSCIAYTHDSLTGAILPDEPRLTSYPLTLPLHTSSLPPSHLVLLHQ